MSLPAAVSRALIRYGVPADTLSWIEDLYQVLGPPAIDALAEVVAAHGLDPSRLGPEHLAEVRPLLGARYLRESHPAWSAGRPTPGFWRSRSLEGGATGVATPLGDLADPARPFAARVAEASRRSAGPSQPSPRGLLLLSRHAHYEGHPGSFSFDLVPAELDPALALNAALGRQYTLPGSIGAASGRASDDDSAPSALLWEIQPNVYKPGAERNREANPAFRRHRNWPLTTTIAALAWLLDGGYRVFVLRGAALPGAHEVDPARPLGAAIQALHDRTVEAAAAALELRWTDVSARDDQAVLGRLTKVLLDREIGRAGLAAVVREVRSQGAASDA